MSTRHPSQTAAHFQFQHVLICVNCGSRRDCLLKAFLRYTRQGWPRCCGETMILTARDYADTTPGEQTAAGSLASVGE